MQLALLLALRRIVWRYRRCDHVWSDRIYPGPACALCTAPMPTMTSNPVQVRVR